MARKTGLGRGFESLLPGGLALEEEFDPTAATDEKVSELRQLNVGDVSPNPDQPRKSFDEEALSELTESIRQHGIIQPIVVTPHDGGYQIIAGERRWRAARSLELAKIPAIIRTLSNQHKLELALIENLVRRDLNPLETATAYLKLQQQFNMNLEAIGKSVGGKAISTISNTMRLLNLPDDAKHALVASEISEGHARQILALNDEAAQAELLQYIKTEGWSVRKCEQYVVGFKKGQSEQPDGKAKAAIKQTRTETNDTQALGKRLGAEVRLKTTAKGGQLIIAYKSDDDLERISALLLERA